MKVAMYGATGMIGRRILQELLERGHQVTAVVRDPARLTAEHPNLTVVQGDILDEDSIAASVSGHDAVISAYGPKVGTGEEGQLIQATQSLLKGVKRAGVPRLIAVGGAGSLEVSPGVQLLDTPDFPEIAKPIASAHRDALAVYRREEELNWTVVSPSLEISPGEKTRTYRVGTDHLLFDDKGKSRISAEDFAVALVDELENPRFSRRRFTVGY